MTMNRMLIGLIAVGVLVFSLPLPVFAHHGRGDAYDTKNPLTLKATVTQLLYVNPHVQLYFDTKDEKGKVTHWNGEMTDIGQLLRAGWSKKRFTEALKPGTPVTVTIQKSKAPLPPGQGVAVVMKIEDEKGEVVGLVRRGAGGQE
jgi:Family of unknown function (DUF6152)